jgi:hypothetical protein
VRFKDLGLNLDPEVSLDLRVNELNLKVKVLLKIKILIILKINLKK